MAKDLYRKPFDEGTKFKLSILESYFEEWLPVFTRAKIPTSKVINIFDFFAGEGKDKDGVEGSPLVILRILDKLKPDFSNSDLKVNVYINEYIKSKFESLIQCVELKIPKGINVSFYNLDFNTAFNKLYPEMKNSANFLFLDQCGVKYITDEVFQKIISLPKTDFLFFISSSYFVRFKDDEDFISTIGISKQEIEGSAYYHIHRAVFKHYKNLIQKDKKYFLSSFSIKKKANIYGLIFGTNNPLGIYKFLNVCWKKDQLRGEANFDIDTEKIDLNKPSLFTEENKPNKVKVFESKIENKILNKEIANELDLILFALESGFLPKHIKPIIQKLEKENKISKFNLKISREVLKTMSYSNKINLKQ